MKKLYLAVIATLSMLNCIGQIDDSRMINIPVVFHVIYCDNQPDNGMSDEVRNSDDGNSTTRLPKEKIIAELADLDNDFQMQNPDLPEVIGEYKSAIGNPKIHFILKQILYVEVNKSRLINRRDNLELLQTLSPQQEPATCLNVYVSWLRYKGKGTEGVTPCKGYEDNPSNDVVNLNFSWVGLRYRLLSHEVGHWLGLWHVDDMNQITKDKITDIPVQNILTDIDCVICNSPKVTVIDGQASKFNNANYNNFMDYSGCRRMFSTQQTTYMRNTVIKLRPQLWKNSEKVK